MITFALRDFKSILNVRKLIDNWFWDKYGINPYNGCSFGCIYCDSRSAKYYLPSDFENNIIIKNNIGRMLEKRLLNARTLLPDVVGYGGTTDAYQSAEVKYKNTRICLEIIEKYKYPVHMITKSLLIARDIDLLEQIGMNNWCTVSFTITTLNKSKARFLETRAPAPDKRLEMIKIIKSKTKNIQCGILMIPVVPLITDDENEMEDLVKNAKDYGADYIIFGSGMTLRDLQALWFLKKIYEKYPVLMPEYERLYNFKYDESFYNGNYAVNNGYSMKHNDKFLTLCDKYKIPYRIKRFIPDDYRKLNYIISEKLLNMSYYNQITGRCWQDYFWMGQNIQNLKESIDDIYKRNELKTIRGMNDKFKDFVTNELSF